jgi:ComF family protein
MGEDASGALSPRAFPGWAPAFAGARRVIGAVVAYALPPRCPGCGVVVQADHSFCLACWQSLDFLGRPACSVCAEPLELAFHADAKCGACLADPPPFDRVRAAVGYGPIARALALKLKYGRRPGIAVTMARQMRRAAGGALEGALVAPVPLHRRRIWTRGYNQAALIGQALMRETMGDVPRGWEGWAPDLLHRRRATPILRGLGRSARARAVQGAFVMNPAERARVKGRDVVLIDDVFTTGATAKACAKVLKRAGAARVIVLCWARVVRDDEDVR